MPYRKRISRVSNVDSLSAMLDTFSIDPYCVQKRTRSRTRSRSRSPRVRSRSPMNSRVRSRSPIRSRSPKRPSKKSQKVSYHDIITLRRMMDDLEVNESSNPQNMEHTPVEHHIRKSQPAIKCRMGKSRNPF